MIIRAGLASVVAIVVLPLAVVAQEAGAGRVNQVCKAELASLCADAGEKGGRGFRCLADNQAKLGAECATVVKAAQERRVKFQAACKADVDKLCTGDAAKGGGAAACLRAKVAELSKPCADLIATLPAPKAKQ